MIRRGTALLACLLSTVVFAQPAPIPRDEPAAAPTAPAPKPAQAPAVQEDPAAAFLASLKKHTGAVALPGGLAALNLDKGFHYLNPDDTKRLLEEGWGNPPGSGDGTLGMILPDTPSPLADDGWGVIISYSDDGYVSDEDASQIDYAEILKDMQESTAAGNEERTKAGYSAVTLVGWAEPPHYDATAKKVYWAKDLIFGEAEEHTLNYAIRVLGRQGVLELNAVAGMSQLERIRDSMRKVVTFADFTEGNRYADFNPETDKVAAYGLAALVAGGVAAKTGLLTKLVALLVAGKKFVIIAVLALGGLLFKVLRRKAAAAPPANPA